MSHRRWIFLLAVGCLALLPDRALAQRWSEPVRGSWLRDGEPARGDVVLMDGSRACEIVVSEGEASPVQQAARFLARDLEWITGQRPPVVARASGDRPALRLVTLGGDGGELPEAIDTAALEGRWEAYSIATVDEAVWLVGSNARGTAFAVYTLCERLGVDPLHLWTGYRPERRERLVLREIDHSAGPPAFKYRGLFHDDEDILPRPFERSGYPLRIGDVPLEWYEKFFETALRLRMNIVAPYTRAHRRFEVQRTASDWGLYYTSHHYDILLSNPFGYRNFDLARERGVAGAWDWLRNREGMLRYWRAGVEENGELDAIWPVGLRGTDDYGYRFPAGMSEEEQNRVFQEVIGAQLEVTRELLADQKQPGVFHFTLYGEMLDKYLAAGGSFEMPEDVILIWPDDNDGRMRALPTPENQGKWRHGIYYHLAYWGPVAKQAMAVVPPRRVAHEFKKTVAAGATEYMLLNVSELREFVMETRMIAEICWDPETALADTALQPMPAHLLPHVPRGATVPIPADQPSASAERFIEWWSREYFGADAAADAAQAYRRYYDLLDSWEWQWWAADKVPGAVSSLIRKLAGESFLPARETTLPTLREREQRYQAAFEVIERARAGMNRAERQFFHDHLLPLTATWRHTQAAIQLVEAMDEPDLEKAWALCEQAMEPLEQLELEILRAEHPPFEQWYRASFIRHEHTGLNLHRPYLVLRQFLSSGGTRKLDWPEAHRRPDLREFLPLLRGGL